jgi:hypothetical protein
MAHIQDEFFAKGQQRQQQYEQERRRLKVAPEQHSRTGTALACWSSDFGRMQTPSVVADFHTLLKWLFTIVVLGYLTYGICHIWVECQVERKPMWEPLLYSAIVSGFAVIPWMLGVLALRLISESVLVVFSIHDVMCDTKDLLTRARAVASQPPPDAIGAQSGPAPEPSSPPTTTAAIPPPEKPKVWM